MVSGRLGGMVSGWITRFNESQITNHQTLMVCDELELFGRILALGDVDCDRDVVVPYIIHFKTFR